MKLWILKRLDSGWYDEAFGFVLKAETEQDARNWANLEKGDEDSGTWLNSKFSSCRELIPEGVEVGVILRDFKAG